MDNEKADDKLAGPMNDRTPRLLPYSGVRIVEFGSMIAGPGTGRILADLGADLIKVEPLSGEMMRTYPPIEKGASAPFIQFNRNKRSIAIDLASEEGRQIARSIVLKSDVFFQNFRPGLIEQMGLGYEELRKENPRLIYASISGYGETGPYADQPAFDVALQGFVGFMPHQGGYDVPEPVRCLVVDKVTSYSAAMAIMAALAHRDRHGEAQKVSINMLDAYATFIMIEQMYGYTFVNSEQPRKKPDNLYCPIRVSDGYVIGLIGPEPHFLGFVKALEREDLIEDPRFANIVSRFQYTQELMKEVEPQAARITRAQFIQLMQKFKVPFGPVNSVEDFVVDPQVLHNRTFVETLDPNVGPIRNLGSFAKFERSPARVEGLAPTVGEHTDQILAELGFDPAEVEGFKKRNVIR